MVLDQELIWVEWWCMIHRWQDAKSILRYNLKKIYLSKFLDHVCICNTSIFLSQLKSCFFNQITVSLYSVLTFCIVQKFLVFLEQTKINLICSSFRKRDWWNYHNFIAFWHSKIEVICVTFPFEFVGIMLLICSNLFSIGNWIKIKQTFP